MEFVLIYNHDSIWNLFIYDKYNTYKTKVRYITHLRVTAFDTPQYLASDNMISYRGQSVTGHVTPR